MWKQDTVVSSASRTVNVAGQCEGRSTVNSNPTCLTTCLSWVWDFFWLNSYRDIPIDPIPVSVSVSVQYEGVWRFYSMYLFRYYLLLRERASFDSPLLLERCNTRPIHYPDTPTGTQT